MYKVFYIDSPNVFKVTILLEEIGADYEKIPVDVFKGEQFDPEILKLNPHNRVPILVDMNPDNGGEPISVFESGAILLYLAEKHGRFLPTTARERTTVLQWLMWQMSAQGPTFGQAGYFINYAPEHVPPAIERFQSAATRLYRVLNDHLENRDYIGEDYSIADIACWPWHMYRTYHQVEIEKYPALERWFRAIGERPAIKRALGDFSVPPPAVPVSLLDAESRKILYQQK